MGHSISIQEKVAYWEAKIHDKYALVALNNNIQTWTQMIKYLQSLVEKAKKKRTTIDTYDFNCLKTLMDAEVNLGIERATIVRKLKKELKHLKAKDLRIDQRLNHVQTRYDGIKRHLGF